MKKQISNYFETIKVKLGQVIATADGKPYQFEDAIDMSVQMIIKRSGAGGKLLFIGNGASASIASHMATDFLKSAGICALSFNDSVLLTCISNDYGYEHVFEKPLELFADKGDILFAISSSGKSENILNSINAARDKGAKIVTLSGFDEDNPLKKLGDINFYVPSSNYGHVETVHQAICHCLVDMVVKKA